MPIFTYENGYATCSVTDSLGRVFKGEAHCADEDRDFESALIGGTIAEMRAQIQAAKTYRDDLKIKIQALKQYYYSIKNSKHFNPKSYEAKMLYRQMSLLNNDLEIAKHQLAVLKLNLYEYIRDKDEFHAKMRKSRTNQMLSDK